MFLLKARGRDLWAMVILAGGLWAMTWSWVAFPMSLTLPVLAALSAAALRRLPKDDRPLPRLAPRMVLGTAALPGAAIGAYAMAAAVPLEWPLNVVTVSVAGPVALWFWGSAIVWPIVRRQRVKP